MANGRIEIPEEIIRYLDIIPQLETKLISDELDLDEKLKTYRIYVELLRKTAYYNFISFNKFLELDEDANVPNKKFYHHRQHVLHEVFEALNDMEVYDKYDTLIVNTPPRLGKTTTGIRFLAWVIGRYPTETQLATSYSDSITTSFYNGVMEVILGDKYPLVFPLSPLVSQNAKRQEIYLKEVKRYPSILFVPINGSMTGRAESSRYLYVDDIVSGIEEALSLPRLESLWGKYTTNAKQRKKDGAKEIHIATPWSVHDPISRVAQLNADNPRCKIIKLPCYDENGESNFDFYGGFSTKYYREIESTMDSASFSALYLQEPIEREGILYHEDDLQYYMDLPEGEPDAIIAVCDTKGMGKDYLSAPIGYVYGEDVYVEDVVFTNELPDYTIPKVVNAMLEHKVQRLYIEAQSGGDYFGRIVDENIRERGGRTSIRTFFTTKNKEVKIVMHSDFVKKNFIFKDKSKYSHTSPYGVFMKQVMSYSQTAKKNAFDDAVDSLAMLSEFVQTIMGTKLQILDRRKFRL